MCNPAQSLGDLSNQCSGSSTHAAACRMHPIRTGPFLLAAWAAAGAMMSFMVLEEKNTCGRMVQTCILSHGYWLCHVTPG